MVGARLRGAFCSRLPQPHRSRTLIFVFLCLQTTIQSKKSVVTGASLALFSLSASITACVARCPGVMECVPRLVRNYRSEPDRTALPASQRHRPEVFIKHCFRSSIPHDISDILSPFLFSYYPKENQRGKEVRVIRFSLLPLSCTCTTRTCVCIKPYQIWLSVWFLY